MDVPEMDRGRQRSDLLPSQNATSWCDDDMVERGNKNRDNDGFVLSRPLIFSFFFHIRSLVSVFISQPIFCAHSARLCLSLQEKL